MMGDIQGFKWWTKGTVRALLPTGPVAGIAATQEFQKVLAQVFSNYNMRTNQVAQGSCYKCRF